jgi:pimeloyl-ACP methyl ester carboxylesterase
MTREKTSDGTRADQATRCKKGKSVAGEAIEAFGRVRRLLLGAVLALAACGDGSDGPSGTVDAGDPPSAGCSDATLPSGALYRICFPGEWNGELVIYAHGYMRTDEPLAIQDNLVDGVPVSSLVTGLGYAFATTSYRANGLVADVAVADLVDLDERFREAIRPDPTRTYLVGVSEGGLSVAQAAELTPARFSGALSACGPVGDFPSQVDYLGDFRVVFDYFFPGVLPGTAIDIPDELQANWESQYVPAVLGALVSDPDATQELLDVTGAATDANDIFSIGATVVGVLWYSVYATEDAQAKLGGQFYENANRVYQGSTNDAALNAGVARFSADAGARAELERFDTSGELGVPVVTLHTTGDPIVPVSQQQLFGTKVSQAGAQARLSQRTVDRYGHCNFEPIELQTAFMALTQQVSAASRVAHR